MLISLETSLFVLELVVLLFLIWHIRALSRNSKDLELVIRELHASHKELHDETRNMKSAVDRMEADFVGKSEQK